MNDFDEATARTTRRDRGHSCTPGDVTSKQLSSGQSLHHLNLQKGKVRIHPKIRDIRALLDKYSDMKPIVNLHESFNFSRMFWEGFYNFFHFLSFPILLYREGKYGLIPRQFAFSKEIEMPWITPILTGLIWLCLVVSNILF